MRWVMAVQAKQSISPASMMKTLRAVGRLLILSRSMQKERRSVFYAVRAGMRPSVPAKLYVAAPDHLNAVLWRSAKVPGTIAAA
jgi:hypothetical protein